MSAPLLAAHGLTRRFAGVLAVDGLHLELHEGEIHGLIGPNGAGKTTAFNLLTGLVRPSAGTIELRGRRVTHLPAHLRARLGLGRVFQVTQLFRSLTVREHLELSDPHGSFGTWVDLLDLGPWLSSRPQGLPYGVGRKVELAMALAAGHPVLLLDEPVAGLTQGERRTLAEVLRGVRGEGRTLLVVEHDLEWTLSLVDRLTVLQTGKVIAQGAPLEVSRLPVVREAYLGEPGGGEATG